MKKSAEHLGKKWLVEKGNAYLMIIITGDNKEEVYSLVVESKRKQNELLKIRSNIYLALKSATMDILDVAVPPADMAKLMDALDEIATKYKMYLPMYGHAGDGNLHLHILTKKEGGVKREHLEDVRKDIYVAAVSLGGTITAEHGIGKIRKLDQYLDKKAVKIMMGIKRIFDPNNILNPGTVIR